MNTSNTITINQSVLAEVVNHCILRQNFLKDGKDSGCEAFFADM